jgi:hypothetical protein
MATVHFQDMDALQLKLWAKEIRYRISFNAVMDSDSFDELLSRFPRSWATLSLYIVQLNSLMERRLSDFPELCSAFESGLRGMSIKVAVLVMADRARQGGIYNEIDWAASGSLRQFLPKLNIDDREF